MAAARLVTWGLLLAAGVPTATGRPPLRGTVPAAGDPSSSWGRRRPDSAPPGDTSGELSGAGDPDGERWADAGPVRWSRPLPAGAVTGTPVPPGGGPAPDGVEEPFITWHGQEAEGPGSPRMETAVPPTAAPMDVGRGSLGPGHGSSVARTTSPRPTVSTIAPCHVPGLAEAGGPAARGVPPGPSAGHPRSLPGTGAATPGAAGRAAPEGTAETWTLGLPAHQRSTRRAPPGTAPPGTAPPGTRPPGAARQPALSTSPAALAAPGTPHAGTAPEEEPGSPQRVRGAMSPPNATEAAVPAAGTPGPRRSDAAGMRPPGPSTAAPSSTWRRGLIRVTTQRALPRPPAPERGPGVPPAAPEPGAPCTACGVPRGNGTGPRWAELRRALSFAWDAQVYGSAALFLLLGLGCLAGLLGAPALSPPHLPHVLVAHGLLLAASVLRAAFLLLDPYGARGRLPPRAVLLLATAPFPLLLGAFAALLQRLQRLAQLGLLPPPLRSLPALGAAVAVQSAALAAADLLPARLGPAALGLHVLGCAAGALLLLAGLWGCRRVLRGPGSEAPGLRRGAGALAAAAALGLPCCGLQLYGAAWLRGAAGPPGRFSWPCWAAQLGLRVAELALALALLAAAAEPLCRRGAAAGPGHSCWAKALRYFCAGRKAAAPEYPNNCYDWAGAGAERAPASDISKSLIRNAAEQLPLRALKDSNEAWAAGAAPGLSPKCPNAAVAAAVARPGGSLRSEPGSAASLGELAFRPPSPIDLRRSIDQALCRQHLLRDGLFGRPRRRSGSGSGSGSGSVLGSGGLLRCSSLTELPAARPPALAAASASSLESGSLHISWNPWRHGLSSPESPPPAGAPSRAPLLARPAAERDARRGFLALGARLDSRSLSSDTIEL
ncbi:proline-rich transmembrane protein 3 [Rhea pennata]|uniref:proline-rich transmembrane protein 3 n=1 Tax=Rhea pennata TaxID=8795 RepID=UPI002E261E4B